MTSDHARKFFDKYGTQLVTAKDIAKLIGVSQASVCHMTTRKDFPKPVSRLHGRAIYWLGDILQWNAQRMGLIA